MRGKSQALNIRDIRVLKLGKAWDTIGFHDFDLCSLHKTVIRVRTGGNDLSLRASYFFSVNAKMADRLSIRVNDDGAAPTIADDRQVASIQNKTLAFVPFDKLANRLSHFRWF